MLVAFTFADCVRNGPSAGVGWRLHPNQRGTFPVYSCRACEPRFFSKHHPQVKCNRHANGIDVQPDTANDNAQPTRIRVTATYMGLCV